LDEIGSAGTQADDAARGAQAAGRKPDRAAFSGCATSPITGETIFVGMSEAQEIALDRKLAPQQFSQDLGPIQQASVNAYVGEVGAKVQAVSHRPHLPYSYRGLNANYLNAYTFPAGSVGVTRALLVRLDDEAQLAAVLGHEIGHVNARHSAQQQAKAMLAQVALTALDAATSRSEWGQLLVQGGALGASALLASYSREQEREADYLGQRYLVLAGYPASAMVRLHQVLLEEEKNQPGLLETMFSTHPMTQERIQRAQWLAETEFADGERFPCSASASWTARHRCARCDRPSSVAVAEKRRWGRKSSPRPSAARLTRSSARSSNR